MIELGKMQTLTVLRIKDFGVYLGHEGEKESVLLPRKQVPQGTKEGDEIEVFVYKDSMDRIISTTRRPLLVMDEMAVLTVKEKTRIGAFLDWGLEKDLLLPFKEQTVPVRRGEHCLVALYLDKSKRLCATMKVYERLHSDSPYQKGDQVTGTVYRVNPEIGVFVAVDNRYFGLIPKKEIYDNYRTGDQVNARVTEVRSDGKLNLAVRDKAYLQMDTDSETILNAMESFGGYLPFGEKAEPDKIKRELKMSKNAFKRALGHLLKEGKIEIGENRIEYRKRSEYDENSKIKFDVSDSCDLFNWRLICLCALDKWHGASNLRRSFSGTASDPSACMGIYKKRAHQPL